MGSVLGSPYFGNYHPSLRKQWLQREGIRVDAFEQRGTALTNSKAILPEGAQRRDDTLIATRAVFAREKCGAPRV